jgi:hypothetical protein
MTKKAAEPDEMRMPAGKFEDLMRRALDAPPPPQALEPEAPPNSGKSATKKKKK